MRTEDSGVAYLAEYFCGEAQNRSQVTIAVSRYDGGF